jgi:diguanylate cyclase (GGDEF)-like protein/PAS domain S-box-containing protein
MSKAGQPLNPEIFAALVENLTDIVTVHDASAVTVYESPSAAAVLGYGHNGLIGRKPFRALHPKDRERMTEWLWQIRDGVPGAGAPMEFRYRHAQGRWIWLEAVGKNMLDQRGINGLVLTSRDITRRKVAEDRLRHLSMHDMLTGLPNRGLFSDRLARGIAQAADAGRFLALMFVDLDRFKNVNDALGHEYGDQLLRAAASRLRSEVSEIDTVARLGGDEFAVILRSIERPQYAGFVAEKMLRSLGTPLDIDGRSIRLTASIGTSIYPRDAETQTDLMRLADAAKFAAKRAGGNIHTFYEPGLNASSRQSIMLDAMIRRALERSEFELHYQPKVALTTGRITGAEALLRCKAEGAQGIPIGQIVAVAEETGAIIELGDWVTRAACKQVADWHRVGIDVPVAVNLSVRQLARPAVADRMLKIVKDAGIPPNRIELEITESAFMHDTDAVAGVLQKVREHGVRVSVDDFGTGYASLNYLRNLPLDTIKIDQSFVRDVTHKTIDAAIIEAVIGMARAMNVTVVGEGVETRREAEYLRRVGADTGQGYLFSRPLAADQFLSLVRSNWSFPFLALV